MSEKQDWNKMTVNVLKEELKKRGLDQAGKKADLVSRLEAAEPGGQPATVSGDTVVSLDEDNEAEDAEEEAAAETTDAPAVPAADNDAEEMETSQDAVAEDTAEAKEGEEKEVNADENKEEKVGEEGADGDKTDANDEKTKKEKADEAAKVASLFSVEMKREKDSFQLTWHGKKFTVPFRGEIHSDLAAHMAKRSFLVRPINISDVRSEKFQEMIDVSHKFIIDFHDKQFKKATSGFAKFVFETVGDATKYKEELKAYNESLNIESVKFEEDFSPIPHKEQATEEGSIVERLLYVGNLPNDVTEPAVRELFPDALQVIFPPHKEIEENAENIEQTRRYAYLEYATSEATIAAAVEHKDKLLEEEKLFVIKAITVRKEKFGLLTDTLRMILLDKIRKMRRIQKHPWNKSRQELAEIEKAISQNLEKLHSDSAHRKEWGMQLGALDESRLDTEEEPIKIDSINQSQWGRGNRGARGQRGNSGPKRGGGGGGMGMGQGYGGFGGGFGGVQGGYGRGGWNQGGYGSSGFYGAGFGNQNYGGGFNAQGGNFGGKRRAGNDGYGGDWKRSRGRGGYGGF